MQGAADDVLGGRLALRRRLGAGAFGTVYEAVDSKFGGRVAVKVLDREQSQAILRFKREFRSLADVVHPNLVRLYELVVDEHAHYFSMELVDGPDFLAHVTSAPRISTTVTLDLEPSAVAVPPSTTEAHAAANPPRIREAFLQLARGVQALHDAGKLHCDLKPSNVLVTKDGRVVILDFGLIADLQGVDARHRGGMGTPGYAAPEQTRGAALTPAADWYAVGVMLHEALTGELPYFLERDGRTLDIDGDTPAADLARLARDLIAVDPAARPEGAEVLERLGETPRSGSVQVRPRLFGRATELAALREAWRETEEGSGSGVLIRIVGASGIGKTSLVDTFLDELPPERLVLRGRCYEQESVPYKALDSVVDSLAQHLQRLGPAAAAMVPANAGVLGRVFPVLRDVLRSTDGEEGIETPELRRRAFHALRQLLEAVARTSPIVVFLDDVQWGDVDSARLLTDLLRPPNAPRVLTIIGHRPDEGTAFLATLEATGLVREARTIALSELDEPDAVALAAHLLAEHSETGARTIFKEAVGNPLFIQQLAARANDHGESQQDFGLADVILSRVNALDAPARLLVETVALAGQPIEEHIALRAASLDPAASLDAALAIRHARLVTSRARGEAIVLEPAHDRVRESVVAALEAARTRAGHKSIAEALLALSQPDPERLVHHFRGAGDNDRTREFAVLAADRADDALAFDRAASFRGLLLELTADAPDRWQMHEKHAISLANAGRAIEAADAYERAGNALEASVGSLGDHVMRVHVHRREAGGLTLRSGRLELGFRRMERVLSDVGVTLPRSRGSATMLSAGRRMKLLVRGMKIRDGAVTTPAARFRLDALWSALTGIIQLNQTVGDALVVQYLIEALEAGDKSAIARGLGFEQVYNDIIGGRFFSERGERLRRDMDQLVEETGDPFDRAFTLSSHGGAAWFRSDWQRCFDYNETALKIFHEQCRGATWEIALCQAYRLPSLAYLGEMKRLGEIVPSALAVARERGDLFAANTLRLGMQSLTLLVQDRPEEAISEADAAIAPFPRDSYIGPHYHHLFAVMQADLYRGNTEKAWDAIMKGWRDIEHAKLLAAQTLRIEVRHLRSRAAIAHAVADRKNAKALLGTAESDAAKIAKDSVALAAPFASLLRAGIAGARNKKVAAVTELRAACTGLERAKMALYLNAARDRLGHLVGGTEGVQLRAASAEWMKGQGIVDPARMVGMLVPGI